MIGLKLLKLFLLLALLIGLLAPFTFLKPEEGQQDVDEVATVAPEKAKPIVKKVIEKPLHNVNLPDFSAIRDVKTKKKAFFDFIRPAIVRQNNALLATRAKLNVWLEQVSLESPLTSIEHQELGRLVKSYRVSKDASTLSQINELLLRIDVVPTALVLVQAANESAWGTSRFSRIGLNFFGLWCYRQGCGMVPGGRDTGAKHEVAAFTSIDAAVKSYFRNINSHNAYRVFRTIRFELRAQNQPLYPEILATGLLAYSQRGADYIVDITSMLRQNQQYFVSDVPKKSIAMAD